MIEAEMYGMMPSAKMVAAGEAAAQRVIQLRRARRPPTG
jgi:hypothetical protein